MKIKIILYGKTSDDYLKTGIDIYLDRLKHYLPFSWHEIPESGVNHSNNQEKYLQNVLNATLKYISKNDVIILLDDKGQQYSSEEFAGFLQKQMNTSMHDLVFLIGGPYGFHKSLYSKAKFVVSLSKMTFTHQIIRLIFVEQLYRAMTIIRNEKYHH